MAVSYIGKGSAATGNATSITIPLVLQIPTNICVIYAYTYAYSSEMIWNVTSGWTKFIDYKNSTYGSIVAAYKFVSYGETNPVISFSGPSKNSIIGESILFGNVDSSAIFDVAATIQTGTGASSPYDNILSEITTVTDGAMAVYIYGIKDNLTSTISNFTEQDDTGTAAGSDAQAGFATKAMATAGGVGSSNLNYGSAGVGVGWLVYKFALGSSVSVLVAPTASSLGLSSTNPTTIQGLISFSPLPARLGFSTTDPTVEGQSIVLETFTDLGGAMALASYALVYDDEDAEIASTGNYVQGTGLEITGITNTEGNMWVADDIVMDFVATRTVGSISVFDEDDIKICTWTFSPALEIGATTEYILEWPDAGIEFPSPLWIIPSAATSGFSTTNPTTIKGSITYSPALSSFSLDTTEPTIPALPTITVYTGITPSNAEYVLFLDDNGDEIASTGEYIQGTGVVLTGVSYTDNRLYADDFSLDIVSATVNYLDLYNSSDEKIARWTLGQPEVIANEEFTFQWPDGGIYFADYILDLWPDEILWAIGTTNPTVLYGSTLYIPIAASVGLESTDPYVIETTAGSILITPDSESLGLEVSSGEVVYGSLVISPNSARLGFKTKFYSGIFYLTALRRSIYANTISRGSY